jgi:hypothetical protein
MANDIANANQAYGALTAEFYISGFTFESAMTKVLWLLKGGEWKKVGDGFDDVNEFVRSLRLDKHRVVADQRQEFVERVKALQPKVSNRAIASALGVAKDTVDRDASGRNRPSDIRKAKQNGTAAGEISHAAQRTGGATRRFSASVANGKSAGRKSLRAWRRRRR